jgi:hypothetical protein
VTPRNNRNGRNTRTSPRKALTGSNETLSKKREPGPAAPLDLDDICSDLSTLPSTPRQQIREVLSGLGRPSQSPNASSKVESGVAPLGRATLPGIPAGALQATSDDTARPRVPLDTLVRDMAIPATNPLAFSPFLDRHHRTPRHILLWTTYLYIVYSSHLYSPWYTPSISATTTRAVSE